MLLLWAHREIREAPMLFSQEKGEGKIITIKKYPIEF